MRNGIRMGLGAALTYGVLTACSAARSEASALPADLHNGFQPPDCAQTHFTPYVNFEQSDSSVAVGQHENQMRQSNLDVQNTVCQRAGTIAAAFVSEYGKN